MPNLFKLPRIQANTAIVNNVGKALIYFTRFWDEFATAIEGQINTINQTVADIAAIVAQLQLIVEQLQVITGLAQVAQQTANDAQETADAAGGGTARSGSATNPSVNLFDPPTWTAGPTVSLTGVSAGNLTASGTGPIQDADVTITVINPGDTIAEIEFRLVEVVGGVDTYLQTWTATVSGTMTPATVSNSSAAAVAAYTAARVTTGAVDYRVDARKTTGADVNDLSLYLYVRRA